MNAEVTTPEKSLLKRIIKQWKDLITAESGKVGRGEINKPIPNPYIAGNPVTGELFFGRDDIQFIGNLKNTSQFLYLFATEIYYTFERRFPHRLSKPQQESFQSYAYEPFRRFLNQVNRVRAHQKLIITIDEFEILENLINDGKIDKELISFLRGIFQTYQWFILAFAGLHTLKEMSYDQIFLTRDGGIYC